MASRASGPAPFLSIAASALSPLILTCEHASPRLPVRVRLDARHREILRSHWGYDIGAWDVTREVARILGASAVGGAVTRLFVDLNRGAGDETLVRKEAEGIALPWNAKLVADEIERRALRYHAPYHAEVDRMIFRRVLRGIRPVLLAVHSFTPVLGKEKRAFDAGVLFAKHARLARRLGRALAEQGLTVRYNQPYSGLAGMMYSAERHGSHHALPCLELELSQALFRDAGAAKRLAGIVARGLQVALRL